MISGIHHITAIASHPQRTLDFYAGMLGLRLVKLTVNFDDPGTYHFYFGDAQGTPGSILTFFPWPGARTGTVGNGQVSATAFAITPESVDFWCTRLSVADIDVGDELRFGERVLRFHDPDGLPLELVATQAAATAGTWPAASIPEVHAIRSFHSATLAEEGYERTAALLEGTMGLRAAGQEGNRYRYAAAAGDRASIVDVVCSPAGRPGRLGAGTVHHIAWRTPDDAQQSAWRTRLVEGGFNVSPVMDRTYFHSIYFREPGGVLFEIATDPPGFAVDEPPDRLGERLSLPPWLEPDRASLDQRLPMLTLPAHGGPR